MAGQVHVVLEDLRACERRAETVVEQVGPLDPGGELLDAAQGIPGADSVLLLKNVGSLWEHQLRTWREQVHRYGEKLHEAAANYRTSDEAAAADYRAIPRDALG